MQLLRLHQFPVFCVHLRIIKPGPGNSLRQPVTLARISPPDHAIVANRVSDPQHWTVTQFKVVFLGHETGRLSGRQSPVPVGSPGVIYSCMRRYSL